MSTISKHFTPENAYNMKYIFFTLFTYKEYAYNVLFLSCDKEKSHLLQRYQLIITIFLIYNFSKKLCNHL